MNIITIHGLSTDTKPTGEEYHGCTFIETDTHKQFIYDRKKGWERSLVYEKNKEPVSGSCLCIKPITPSETIVEGLFDEIPEETSLYLQAVKFGGKFYYCWGIDNDPVSLFDATGKTYTQEEFLAILASLEEPSEPSEPSEPEEPEEEA